MALQTPTFTRPVTEEGLDEIVATWGPAGNADTFAAIKLPQRADKSIQAFGTFGGATIVLNGSNDGVNFGQLHDAFGNLIAITDSKPAQVTETTVWVQPAVTAGGGGTSLTVVMAFRRVVR